MTELGGRRTLVMLVAGMGLYMGAAEAEAQQAVLDTERTIRVSGVGEVEVEADEAQLMFAVETRAETAQEAGRENARRMERVIAALVNAGIPRREIDTRNYSLRPEYVHDEPRREPRIRGYRAANRMVLTTRELERVGSLIDLALDAGANRMEDVRFGLRDPEAARVEALGIAVSRARASAEAIAAALGVRLGRVLDASTTAQPYRAIESIRMRDVAVAEAAVAPPTPIQPGEQTVRAQVSLAFAIEGGL